MKKDMLCPKHKAAWEDYADRGPHRPLPPGMTYAQMRSQLVVIENICAGRKACSNEEGTS